MCLKQSFPARPAWPVHLGITALLCCPHLFYSQGQGDQLYDGMPFITVGTITGDVSLSENFKPILPPHLSPSLSSLSLCVSFLFGLPSAPFLSFPHNASLRGSSSATLQVRLSLTQAHLYRSQHSGCGGTVFCSMLIFSLLLSNNGKLRLIRSFQPRVLMTRRNMKERKERERVCPSVITHAGRASVKHS